MGEGDQVGKATKLGESGSEHYTCKYGHTLMPYRIEVCYCRCRGQYGG